MPPGAPPGLPAYYGRIWRFPGPATLCKGAIYYITGSTHSYCKTGRVELPLVIHYSYIISWEVDGDAEGDMDEIDPFKVLKPLLRNEVYTLDNVVQYWQRTLTNR